jgi:hypothetical protein
MEHDVSVLNAVTFSPPELAITGQAANECCGILHHVICLIAFTIPIDRNITLTEVSTGLGT